MKTFDEQRALRRQAIRREIDCQIDQIAHPGRISRPYTAQIGRHVRNHKIYPVGTQDMIEMREHLILPEITQDELDPGNRFHRQKIECNDSAVQARTRDRQPFAEHLRSRSTCDQAPGALPRSTMVMPRRINRSCASISISLKAARER